MHTMSSIFRCCALLFAVSAAAGAQTPEGLFRVDWNLQATLSAPVDPFWNQYQQYIAESSPLAVIRMGLEEPGRWKLHADVALKQQFAGWQPTNLTIPLPGPRAVPVEYHAFQTGYLWYDFSPLQVTFGRNKLHYGPMEHSLLISDSVEFMDQLRLRMPVGDWVFDYALTSPETRNGMESDYRKSTFFVIRRLEWHWESFVFAFTEQALLDRQAYTLTDFMPVILFHQMAILPFNTSMTLDADWRATPQWRFSGQLSSDEADASLMGIPDTANPNILGFLVGAEFRDERWDWNLDVGATHYLFGNFDTEGAKAIHRVLLDNGVQQVFLSSPYGPGAQWINTRLAWKNPGWTLGLRAELWTVLQGVTLAWPYPGTPPAENYDVNGRFSGEVRWSLGDFVLSTGPSLLVRNQNLNPQWKLSLSSS